jgi:hypothetical protein
VWYDWAADTYCSKVVDRHPALGQLGTAQHVQLRLSCATGTSVVTGLLFRAPHGAASGIADGPRLIERGEAHIDLLVLACLGQ